MPDKSEWAKKGLSTEESQPFFENVLVGLRGGGSIYKLGYSDRFDATLPTIGIVIRSNLPFIWHPVTLAGEIDYLQHTWKKDFNDITEETNITTSNYIFGLNFGIDIPIWGDFSINPHIGGGYVFQNSTMVGANTTSSNNYFPFGGGGLDLSYRLNEFMNVSIIVKSIAEIERWKIIFSG